MKKFLSIALPILFIGYLLFEMFARCVLDKPGDPLVPLGIIILLMTTSVIFRAALEILNIVSKNLKQKHSSGWQNSDLN